MTLSELEDHIRKLSGKESLQVLIKKIMEEPKVMPWLIDFFCSDDKRIAQYTSWVVANMVDDHKALINPYLDRLAQNLSLTENYTVIRNTIRIFQFADIPENLEGQLIEKCFGYIHERKYPVAIKAFSVTVAERIINKYPELIEEFIYLLEEQIPLNTVAFSNRAKKCLKRLAKLST